METTIGSIETVFFDLDGTLADPKIGITTCIQHALRRMGRPVPETGALVRYIGPPLRSTFRILLETADPVPIEEAVRFYRERYNTVGVFEYEHYQGVEKMLDTLASRALRLYVVSSKAAIYLPVILKSLNVADFFLGSFGPDLEGRLDNKADLLAHVLEELGVEPTHAVMVGDRALDIIAGKSNGTRTVGVTYGYGTNQELAQACPDHLCATPSDLADLLFSLGCG